MGTRSTPWVHPILGQRVDFETALAVSERKAAEAQCDFHQCRQYERHEADRSDSRG